MLNKTVPENRSDQSYYCGGCLGQGRIEPRRIHSSPVTVECWFRLSETCPQTCPRLSGTGPNLPHTSQDEKRKPLGNIEFSKGSRSALQPPMPVRYQAAPRPDIFWTDSPGRPTATVPPCPPEATFSRTASQDNCFRMPSNPARNRWSAVRASRRRARSSRSVSRRRAPATVYRSW